jgi:hypothetical protein
MVGTRSQKKVAATHNCNPLDNAAILEPVLRYVGGGEGLYIHPVSKGWKECYDRLPTRRRPRSILRQTPSSHTAFHAAFGSVSRLRLAHECGFQLDASSSEPQLHRLQEIEGQYADIKTLTAAHALGLEFSDRVLHGAARGNRLASLKWLCRQ